MTLNPFHNYVDTETQSKVESRRLADFGFAAIHNRHNPIRSTEINAESFYP
jgi:hypothetical protein